eukprot:2767303-Amphidinium_carterae.2
MSAWCDAVPNSSGCHTCKQCMSSLGGHCNTWPGGVSWHMGGKQNFRLDTEVLRDSLVALNKPLSAIWGYPFFGSPCLKPDWLHVVDQGVAQHFLGAILSLFLGVPGLGTTVKVRNQYGDSSTQLTLLCSVCERLLQGIKAEERTMTPKCPISPSSSSAPADSRIQLGYRKNTCQVDFENT